MLVSRSLTGAGAGALDSMRAGYGSDTLDAFLPQQEPPLIIARQGDSSVQFIQLVPNLDQPELAGWPLVTTMKVTMLKCDKCSREFCSLINYRRHIRVHRRSLNVDKESHKIRDVLAAFWDKLSLDDAIEIASFTDATLKEIPGSSIVKALALSLRVPEMWTIPHVYMMAGAGLLDIISGKHSRFPVSSEELLSLLDDASENTFLCAGMAEALQKYVFDAEAAKIALDSKNVTASVAFFFEQKLVKAWLAEKDTEALRCQKLLVEEEEVAEKRLAKLLERKKQKRLRQREQRAREQSNEQNLALVVNDDSVEVPFLEEASSPQPTSDASDAPDLSNDGSSIPDPVQFSNHEEEDVEGQFDINMDIQNHTQCVEAEVVHPDHYQWQISKSPRSGRNSSDNNIQPVEAAQKHIPAKDHGAVVSSNNIEAEVMNNHTQCVEAEVVHPDHYQWQTSKSPRSGRNSSDNNIQPVEAAQKRISTKDHGAVISSNNIEVEVVHNHTQCVEAEVVHPDHHQWQISKSPRSGRNSSDNNIQPVEAAQKHIPAKDHGAVVSSNKVWTKKLKEENVEPILKPKLEEAVNQADGTQSEMIIGSLTIPLVNSTPWKSEVQSGKQPGTSDNVQHSVNQASNKRWVPVGQQDKKISPPIQKVDPGTEDVKLGKFEDQTLPDGSSCVQSFKSDDVNNQSKDCSPDKKNSPPIQKVDPGTEDVKLGKFEDQTLPDGSSCVQSFKSDDVNNQSKDCSPDEVSKILSGLQFSTDSGKAFLSQNKREIRSGEQPGNPDNLQHRVNQAPHKLWMPVNRRDKKISAPIPKVNPGTEDVQVENKDQTAPDGISSVQASKSDEPNNQSKDPSPDEVAKILSGLQFSTESAQAFLAQRWKDAMSAEHVKLEAPAEPEAPASKKSTAGAQKNYQGVKVQYIPKHKVGA